MNTYAPISASAEPNTDFQFYPTPPRLVDALISPYYGHTWGPALEPSAGRGDIADALKRLLMVRAYVRDGETGPQVNVCEVSADLRAILASKGHRLIGTDFLSMVAPYSFDLIVMNPPFARGAEHVLKAWDMLSDGGRLASVLSESALERTTGHYARLAQVIQDYGTVEHIGQPFKGAERQTGVECVIVRLEKPESETFQPFAGWSPKEDAAYTDAAERNLPAPRELIQAIVAQYSGAMLNLKAFHTAQTGLYRSVPDSEQTLGKPERTYNEQIDRVKVAFWNLIFERTRIGEVTTSAYRQEFMKTRAGLSQMEFSEATIYEVLHRFMQDKDVILGACVMGVFKTVTSYSMDNIERDKQWHTNKLHKITEKIIVPDIHGDMTKDKYASWSLAWHRQDFLNDLDKVLTMFGGHNGVCTAKAIEDAFKEIRLGKVDYSAKFETPNFYVRVFKKGTAHLWFRDTEALSMINQYAAARSLFVLPSGK